MFPRDDTFTKCAFSFHNHFGDISDGSHDTAMTVTSEPTRSADDFQIRRAQALCAQSPELQADLEVFLGTAPSHAQMAVYLKQLKAKLAAAIVGNFKSPRA